MHSHGSCENSQVSAASCAVTATRVSHFLDAENLCEFLQVPLLSMGVHGTLIRTLISLLLIIVIHINFSTTAFHQVEFAHKLT